MRVVTREHMNIRVSLFPLNYRMFQMLDNNRFYSDENVIP